MRGLKVKLTALFADVPVEHVLVKWNDLKAEKFLKMNPLGKIPVLETSNGFIFESQAIMRHLARLSNHTQLLGASNYEKGLVDQWLDFTQSELDSSLYHVVGPILGRISYDEEAY